jgi:hypothetical protein
MAQYKVLQDIEAEDKFVGPLTLKQFILAGVTVICGYLIGFLFVKNLWFLSLPLLPIFLFSGFLAWPWGRDQPTEIWLLAKIRFMVKPRRRVWDQTGMQELVTITAPKYEVKYTGDNLSQTEVKSRLKALANTLDSRGWAVKNAAVNMYNQPAYADTSESTDRLIEMTSFAHEVPNADVHASDDILDEHSNPTAQHLDQMITESADSHRLQAIKKLEHVRDKISLPKHNRHHKKNNKKPVAPPPDFWFMDQTTHAKTPKGYATFNDHSTVTPVSDNQATSTSSHSAAAPLTEEEKKVLDTLNKDGHKASYGQTKVIDPLNKKHPTKHAKQAHNREASTSTAPANPAILDLANNDDLTVATLARQANKSQQPPDGEVVIKLR